MKPLASTSESPPPFITRVVGSGFADFTLVHRFPRILAEARSQSGAAKVSAAWDLLLEDVQQGRRIDTTGLARPSRFWGKYLDRISGRHWSDLPFFDVEFLFYHAMNSLAGFFDSGHDVFACTRAAALNDAMADLEQELASSVKVPLVSRLHDLLHRSTFGNESDYSQLGWQAGSSTNRSALLVDESKPLAALLAESPPPRVDLILDNAGRELCWDLVLVSAVLEAGVKQVVVHAKPWPLFVSDALACDVVRTVEALASPDLGVHVLTAGARLADALACGQLLVNADPQWGEPRHFSQLEDPLIAEIRRADVVIAKGDLNYRRFVEDRCWPPDTSVVAASAGARFKALALRVLKSEAVAGIPAEKVPQLDGSQTDWRINGRYAVVQWLGG